MNKTLTNIAIIPARGGSKRLPGKNIKNFGGIPLIVHSINFARKNFDIIDEIVVSTDDDEIAQIALSNKVRVLRRPSAISGDNSTTLEAVRHVADEMEYRFKNAILLQPTNPLRPSNLLLDAFNMFNASKSDSLFTVSQSFDKLGKIENGRFCPFNYSYGDRSQDIEPLYKENGLLYLITSELIKSNRLLSANAIPFIVDHPFAKIDIDTIEDFDFAEYILEKYHT